MQLIIVALVVVVFIVVFIWMFREFKNAPIYYDCHFCGEPRPPNGLLVAVKNGNLVYCCNFFPCRHKAEAQGYEVMDGSLLRREDGAVKLV